MRPLMMVKIMSEHINCLHEEQIQDQGRKIAELETRANYKERIIVDIKDDIKDLKESMDSLAKTITDFILKSINDDSALRELVNQQDNRITSLEATNKTLKWAMGIGFTALGTLTAVLGLLITFLH